MSAEAEEDEADEDSDVPAMDDLAARVELLREENRRLRREYRRARRVQFRRTAIGFAVIGVVATVAAWVFVAAREVLVALAATGFFAALLTYYLTPEQVLPASVGERVYAAWARNATGLRDELGLQPTQVYVPRDRDVRLFVPQNEAYTLPAADALEDVLVVPEEDAARGLALEPSGYPLLRELEQGLADELGETPVMLGEQLRDGLVEQFELLRTARVEVAEDASQVRIAVAGSAFGDIDRFDHPVPSVCGAGLAAGLDRPVEVAVTEATDDRFDAVVTCLLGEAEA